MKSIAGYLVPFVISTALMLIAVIQVTPPTTVAKFNLPPKHVFISSYGDHNAIHRIVYHGLFNFGKHIHDAEILILGNSHAELGLSAGKISEDLSKKFNKKIKVVNLAVGWGEGFLFSKEILKHQNLNCKILLLDSYETLNRPFFSPVAEPVLKESKFTSYAKVIEIWSITLKDWLFDGYLPRIMYLNGNFYKQRFLNYPVGFRKWRNGDVWDYWFPTYGEIYRNTPEKLISFPKKIETNMQVNPALLEQTLDRNFMQKKNLYVVTTFTPSNENFDFYVKGVKILGLPFINIPFEGVELYDNYHANSTGRSLMTTQLLKNWQENNAALLPLKSINLCMQ